MIEFGSVITVGGFAVVTVFLFRFFFAILFLPFFFVSRFLLPVGRRTESVRPISGADARTSVAISSVSIGRSLDGLARPVRWRPIVSVN